MWPGIARTLLCLVAVGSVPARALAQTAGAGSVTGHVLTQNGMPLAGAKIAASSPTQIGGERVAYTDQAGAFRLPGLHPGEFELVAAVPGLRTVHHRGVRVGVNAPADVTIVMEVQGRHEEVKVIERAPIVPLTTAQVKEVYDEAFMDRLPLESRTSIEDFVGNNVAGGTFVGTRSTRIRGGNIEQNALLVDGFFMNRQKTTFKSLAAMEVQTAGYGADGATAPGGLVTMVTKTGSNRFQVDVNGFHEDSGLRLWRDNLDAGGRSRLTYLNPSVAGPILRDRLWFYANVETRTEYQSREPDASGLFTDPPPYRYANLRGTAKLTWQVAPRHKLESFTLLNRDASKNRDTLPSTQPEAQFMNDNSDAFTGLTWDALLGPTLWLRSQVGLTSFWLQSMPQLCADQPDICLHTPGQAQTVPVTSRFGNYDRIQQDRTRLYEVVNSLEWFPGGGRGLGEHALKLVSRFMTRTLESTEGTPGDRTIQWNGQLPDRQTEFFANDPRLEEARYGYRISTANSLRWTVSLQDAAHLTRHLTVTPGLAVTTVRAANNFGETIISTAALTPHLSVAWDPTHDGRTVLRASFNHYLDADAGRLAGFALGRRVSRQCRWNPDTQAYDASCTYAGGLGGATIGLPCGPQGVDAQGQPCGQKLRVPRTHEVTVGGEREIITGLGVGADLIYRDYRNQFSTKETNRIWNSSGTALEPTGSFRNGIAQTVQDLETPDDVRRQYLGVTATIHKREGRLKLSTAYTWSHLHGNIQDTEVNYWGDIPPRDPLLDGDLPDDVRHSLLTTAVYQWRSWLSLGVAHRYRSGKPYQRAFRNGVTGGDEFRARVGINPGVNLNDPGDDRPLRLPDVQQLNLQVRGSLQPLTGVPVELFADLMNVLSLRTTTAVVEQDGTQWGQPLRRLDPMTVRLGFRFVY